MADNESPKIVVPTSVNFISRSENSGYTQGAKRGNKHGMEYFHGEIPVNVWNTGIELSGDKNYWRADNYKNAKAWLAKNPFWKN